MYFDDRHGHKGEVTITMLSLAVVFKKHEHGMSILFLYYTLDFYDK